MGRREERGNGGGREEGRIKRKGPSTWRRQEKKNRFEECVGLQRWLIQSLSGTGTLSQLKKKIKIRGGLAGALASRVTLCSTLKRTETGEQVPAPETRTPPVQAVPEYRVGTEELLGECDGLSRKPR